MDIEALFYQKLSTHVKELIDRLIPYKVSGMLYRMIVYNPYSLLDVGCGEGFVAQKLKGRIDINNCYKVGIDIFKPYLLHCKENNLYDDAIIADARRLPFREKSFDVCTALDLIEHLEKFEGEQLLEEIEEITRRQIIIFTPNGFLPQEQKDSNVFQIHKSGYKPFEFKKRGYNIKGVNGLRILRGENMQLRFHGMCAPLTLLISLLSQITVYSYPQFAFQILCIKN